MAVLDLSFLRRFLPFASGIPSHDTLNDIVIAIDGELFGTCSTTLPFLPSIGR